MINLSIAPSTFRHPIRPPIQPPIKVMKWNKTSITPINPVKGDVSDSELNAKGGGGNLGTLWKSMKECREIKYC